MMSAAASHLILVVDDDPDIVLGLQDFLLYEGYRVEVANTCAQALARTDAQRYDAVLLDLGLPDGDGSDVLRALQRRDPQLPVIILTAYTNTDRTVGSLTQGAFAYLTKPYHRDELRAVLQRAIGVYALATKAEHAELALHESEARFRSLVEAATDSIILADGEGRVLSWNHAAARLFGYTDAEVEGRSLTMLMPERYRTAHVVGLTRATKDGHSRLNGRPVELEGRRKDGSEFPLELSLAMWTTGGAVFYGGIIRDITARHLAAQALQDSEAFKNHILTSSVDGIIVLDLNGRVQYMNAAWQTSLNLSRRLPSMDNRSWADCWTGADRDRADAAFALAAGGGTGQFSSRTTADDGRETWWDVRLTPMLTPQGTAHRILAIARDITAVIQVQDALRAGEARLDRVVRGSNDGFWDACVQASRSWRDPNFSVWWSPRFRAILGYTQEEFPDVQDSWASRLHPDDRDHVFDCLTRCIEQDAGDYEVEYRLLHQDGAYRWVRARGQIVQRDVQGRPTHIAGSLQSIHERKQMEDRLQRCEARLQAALAAAPHSVERPRT